MKGFQVGRFSFRDVDDGQLSSDVIRVRKGLCLSNII